MKEMINDAALNTSMTSEEEDQSYPYHEDGKIYFKVHDVQRSIASEEDLQAVEEMIIIFQKELEPYEDEVGRKEALKALLPKLYIPDLKSARLLIKVAYGKAAKKTMTSCSPERNGNYVKFRCEHCKQFTLCFYGKLLNKSRTGYVFNERKSILDHEDNCNGCYTIDTLGCMFERGLINSILKNRCEKTGRRKLTTLYLQEECKVRDGSLVSTDIIKKLSSKLLNPVKKTRKARNEEDGEDGADSDSEAEDEAGLSSTRQEAEGEVEEVAGSRANNKKRPRKAAAASSSTGKGKGRGKKAQPVVAESSSDSERDSVIEAEL